MDYLNTLDIIKKKLLECLQESRGIVSEACKCAGISRGTFYVYMNSDPEFKEEVYQINEAAIDFVESMLLRNIEGGAETSIIFFLKTKGRKRGYSEKEPLIDPKAEELSKSVPFTIVDPRTLSDINLDIGGANE